MKIDANDPKWTAYALGEITDEKERAEIESILEESAGNAPAGRRNPPRPPDC